MQGQAFLVTFCAIAKSDWPRAAMERARRKDQTSFRQTLRQAQGERRGISTFGDSATALTLTLSRAAGEGTDLLLAQRGEPAFKPLNPLIQSRQFTRKTPPQKPFALVPKPRPRCDTQAVVSDQFFAKCE